MMVSCVKSCKGTIFKGVDCLHAHIMRAKCNKWKESLTLDNANHVETYVVHIEANIIKVMNNIYDRS